MRGLDFLGVDKSKLPYIGAGLGALVGLVVIYLTRGGGKPWSTVGRSHLFGHRVKQITRTGFGVAAGAVAGAAVGAGVKATV